MPQKYKRRIKLIRPRLQVKLTMVFLGASALALLLQFVLFNSALSRMALRLPHDGPVLLDEMNGLLLRVLLTSFLVFLPIIFWVGILTTFRIAGPVYRFETYLGQVIRGDRPEDCRLRSGDELQDLCDLINRATAPLRERDAARDEPAEPAAAGDLRKSA